MALEVHGWMDRKGSGGRGGLAGTSPTLRGMTSELEGPRPTWGNNLRKVPHLREGPVCSRL